MWAAYAAVLVLVGCGEPVEALLVDALNWTYVPPEADPFVPAGFTPPPCDPTGLLIEFGIYEIDTGLCPWATVSQPTAFAVRAGEGLRLVAYHTPLIAEEEGVEAVMEVRLDDEVLWTHTTPIPADDEVFLINHEAVDDHDRGALVLWHVHNHGLNGYRLPTVAITSGRREVRRAVAGR